MSSPNALPSSWTRLYHDAMRERDNEKLSERIADARRAILDRADEVLVCPSTSSDEWQPLNHALRTLHLLEGGLSREENAAPRPRRTEEVEAALDVLFTQPVTVHQCQHCGCEMVNLDAAIYLAETERRWNVPLPVCPRCDREEYLKLISRPAA